MREFHYINLDGFLSGLNECTLNEKGYLDDLNAHICMEMGKIMTNI